MGRCGPGSQRQQHHTLDAGAFAQSDTVVHFRGMEGVQVELFDLEQEVFSRTYQLIQKFEPLGEVWNVIGTDLIRGGGLAAP